MSSNDESAATAALTLDDGSTVHAEGVRADAPAPGGRIMVAIPVGGIPAGRRIAGAEVFGRDVVFRREFRPALSRPPGGVLTVSFSLEDARDRP